MNDPIRLLSLQELLDVAGDRSPSELVIKVRHFPADDHYWSLGSVELEGEDTLVLR